MIARPLPGAARAVALTALAGYQVVRRVPQLDFFIIAIPAGQDENRVHEDLMRLGAFEFVHPNWRVFPAVCPSEDDKDPLTDDDFNRQWHHDVLDSRLAWDLHTGVPLIPSRGPLAPAGNNVIAIIDSGIRTTHEDLLLNRLEAYNSADGELESQGGSIGPGGAEAPHGTRVTSLATANGNNLVGVSITGVGWNLPHRMIRAFTGAFGGGFTTSAYVDQVCSAAVWAAQQGDRVISASWHGVESDCVLVTADYLRAHDALLVWITGNFGDNLDWGPADDDNLIVVGATDIYDEHAIFGPGQSSGYGVSVDLLAPGKDLYCADIASDNAYTYVSGTSFAAPLVAGLCALIASYDPSLTADEIEAVLKAGAEDVSDPNLFLSEHGRINSYNSLLLIANRLGAESCGTTPNSVGPGAVMEALGSAVVADNELVLRATGLPPGVSARFLIGTELVSWPSGEGYQCAGGSLVTLNPLLKANSDGLVQRKVDLTATPALGMITPGTSTVIQLWYRDVNGGPAGFNFSNSIKISWQ